MFQQTQSRSRQDGSTQEDQVSKEQQQKAQALTSETQRRMEQDATKKSLDEQRQAIDGKMRDVQVKERGGVLKQDVVEATKAQMSGEIDFALSQLTPPSFLEDHRAATRADILKAITERAETAVAQREEKERSELADARKMKERERAHEID